MSDEPPADATTYVTSTDRRVVHTETGCRLMEWLLLGVAVVAYWAAAVRL